MIEKTTKVMRTSFSQQECGFLTCLSSVMGFDPYRIVMKRHATNRSDRIRAGKAVNANAADIAFVRPQTRPQEHPFLHPQNTWRG